MILEVAENDYIAWIAVDADNRYLRAGYCRAAEFSRKAISNERCKIHILKTSEQLTAVQNAYIKVMTEMGIEPDHGKQARRNRAIICHETGVIYASIADAIRANGGDKTNFSNHLARRAGYKTVKGKTYSYHIDN